MATIWLLANPRLLLHPQKLLSPDRDDYDKIEKFCAFLGNSEGRDKIGKVVQFAARFVDGFFREGPGSTIVGAAGIPYCDKLKNLSAGLQTARAWSWMGKSIVEWKTDIQTFSNKEMPQDVKILHMACRFFFAARWFLENFFLLVQAKVLADQKAGGILWAAPDLNRLAKKSWFLAICFGVFTEIAKLLRIKVRQQALDEKYASEEEKQKSLGAYDVEKKKIDDDVYSVARTCLTWVCDSPVSISIGLGYPISNIKLGLSMTIASYLQCQNLYPKNIAAAAAPKPTARKESAGKTS